MRLLDDEEIKNLTPAAKLSILMELLRDETECQACGHKEKHVPLISLDDARKLIGIEYEKWKQE